MKVEQIKPSMPTETLQESTNPNRCLEPNECKGCSNILRQSQVDNMIGNPEFNEWCRMGYCSHSCFEKNHIQEESSISASKDDSQIPEDDCSKINILPEEPLSDDHINTPIAFISCPSKARMTIHPDPSLKYFEVPTSRSGLFLCSDSICNCGDMGKQLNKSNAYLYVSQEVVDFRSDCLTWGEASDKMNRVAENLKAIVYFDAGLAVPLLICDDAAKHRNLDLKISNEDAKYAMAKGKVALRVSPLI